MRRNELFGVTLTETGSVWIARLGCQECSKKALLPQELLRQTRQRLIGRQAGMVAGTARCAELAVVGVCGVAGTCGLGQHACNCPSMSKMLSISCLPVTQQLLLAQGCAQESHQSGQVTPTTCVVCASILRCFQRRLQRCVLHTDLRFLDLV